MSYKNSYNVSFSSFQMTLTEERSYAGWQNKDPNRSRKAIIIGINSKGKTQKFQM